MKIALASDHRGFRLKNAIAQFLADKGMEGVDFGTYAPDSCDYTDYVYPAACAVQQKKVDRAIIICYSGIGSSIVANRIRGVRAALALTVKMAVLSRKHNNSNVLVLAAGFITLQLAKRIVARWLASDFEGGRHLRRLKKIEDIENRECA